jgi:hypothetical protein
MKARRDELVGFYEYVMLPIIHRYKLLDKLVPIHDKYEVDGVLISIPSSQDKDYRKMPL